MKSPGPAWQWHHFLPDEAATLRLAQKLAAEFRPGDLVTLSGDLGAGKTTFARALIRALTRQPALEVPSPTYTLIQTYDGDGFRIVHADLYRVADISELVELGWEDAAENAVVLCEWAEKAGEVLAADRLDIAFAIPPDGRGRHVTLTAQGRFAGRLDRWRAIEALFAKAGFVDPARDYMLGDASVRAYERISDPASGRKAILMIAPRRPDGPAIRLGKSYSTLVHLAESVHAFVAMARGLRDQGFSAPEIFASDLEAGLLLIEDLGPEGVIGPDGPIPERYQLAVDVLAELHARTLPQELPVEGILTHKLHRYDLEALTIETELLLDWFFAYRTMRTPNAAMRLAYVDQWVSVLEPVTSGEKTWTLRDYHSPNLIWMPQRDGLKRMGLIDFQDCVIGHPAYDVVSLLQDARVTVPEELELQLLARYARMRRARDPDFDMQAFAQAYAILGAQRASKILGIFVRLDRRDGKPAYLKHIPRIEAYLRRCLAHPALAKLKTWYATHLPGFAEPRELGVEHGGQKGAADQQGDGSGRGAGNADAAADGSPSQAAD
ncbi:tRNA (adenosine(37)-N6)-threonylcarbamoyltransferase complex ATPase subunit type 1 TsaE [Rhabdaerophilum sp. SD176]|uniref:tRNA (adenosine(37)-N6)-threonylcarbamoyltransferase complex ATPase subunit type 1 TsaE n=1 Tax=Rhabdaerophilum sp. SD176 TaxID=2983548 RepID=UPI0024DFDA64|nr:tRNA (adenosine(37)-N6)-threonylcarbamoyltransferase complex ATPase subunit type 1 TsaE [Rhabdaerophilum sp. SD176]